LKNQQRCETVKSTKARKTMSDSTQDASERQEMIISLTADVVSAYVSNNSVPLSELSTLIGNVHSTFAKMGALPEPEQVVEKQKPAVNPKKSVTDAYIVCLEDGKHFKSLKRHLMTHYGLTPDEYREKWGLDASYPMVAPNYAKARSNLARTMGLGRKRKAA
jgi:predicted transcriptional regulator